MRVFAAATNSPSGDLVFLLAFILLMHVFFGLAIWAWLADLRYFRLYKERRDPDFPTIEDYTANVVTFRLWRATQISVRQFDARFERQTDPVLENARRRIFRRWLLAMAAFVVGGVVWGFLFVYFL